MLKLVFIYSLFYVYMDNNNDNNNNKLHLYSAFLLFLSTQSRAAQLIEFLIAITIMEGHDYIIVQSRDYKNK